MAIVTKVSPDSFEYRAGITTMEQVIGARKLVGHEYLWYSLFKIPSHRIVWGQLANGYVEKSSIIGRPQGGEEEKKGSEQEGEHTAHPRTHTHNAVQLHRRRKA